MPTFTYQAVDATPTGDDGTTAGTLRVVPMRLQKGDFVRTGKEFQVPLTVGTADVALEVTAPGEAYKIVESFTGGNGSGYWVVVKDGDTEWADLEIVSQPGTSLPTAIWEANLVSLRARVDQVEGVAEGSAGEGPHPGIAHLDHVRQPLLLVCKLEEVCLVSIPVYLEDVYLDFVTHVRLSFGRCPACPTHSNTALPGFHTREGRSFRGILRVRRSLAPGPAYVCGPLWSVIRGENGPKAVDNK